MGEGSPRKEEKINGAQIAGSPLYPAKPCIKREAAL